MQRGDIKIYLSGGESNNDPDSSLGGAKSTTEIKAKSSTSFSTLTGVSIKSIDAACPTGIATFDYVNSSDQIRWKSNGNNYGTYVTIDADGDYDVVDDGGVYVTISVTYSSLPSSDTTDTTTISDLFNKLFDSLSKADTYSGDTDYRGFYVTNDVSDETDYLLNPALYVSYEEDTKESGTASSATSTTLTDSTKSWTTNEHKDLFVRLVSGTGAGQSRKISSNTSDTLTVATSWDTNPSTDTNYQICTSLLDFAFEDIYHEETIDTGDGSTTSFSGTLSNHPVLKGQIEITDGSETFTDWDGDGSMTGSAGGTGSITYSSGAWSVTFNTAPANGVSIKAYYSEEMSSIANEDTAPSGVTWKHPVSSNKLNLYSSYTYLRGKGFSQAVWVRRQVYKAFTSEVKYRISIAGEY